MKRTAIIVLAILLLLAGCGTKATESTEAPENTAAPESVEVPESGNAPDNAYTFTDDLGRSVTVETPERTAALLGSFAQIWYLAGGTVCASADDAWEDAGLELPEDAVNLGKLNELSLEKLLASEPDLVLASPKMPQHLEWQETLEKAGIPTAYFDVADFNSYLRMLKVSTDITGRPELYEKNGAEIQAQVEKVLSESKERLENGHAPTVLNLRASASFIRAKNSEGNVLGEMLKALGCENIADADDTLLENLSMERILEADPDFIFFVQTGDDIQGMEENIERFMAENPAWGELTAVKEGRVYHMEKELYNLKPNNRWGEAYEKLEDILSGK